jgi:hypothetical protein
VLVAAFDDADPTRVLTLDTVALSGWTVGLWYDYLIQELDKYVPYKQKPYEVILFNLGVNDALDIKSPGTRIVTYPGGTPFYAPLPLSESEWKTKAGWILDTMHTRWPNARIYVDKVWGRGAPAECGTINGWWATVVAARSSWAFLGTDETVWLEGGDNGATMTTDGTHYSAAAGPAKSALLMTLLGY